MKKIHLILIISFISLYSCANMFNGMVLPNQCKKCELIDKQTGSVLFTNEGCGSNNTNLEDEAQLKAFEMSRGYHNLCDLDVECTTWRKDSDTKE